MPLPLGAQPARERQVKTSRILTDSKYGMTIVVLVGLIICCCLPLTYLSLTGHVTYDLYPFYQAHVTDMRPCLGLDAETNLPIEAKESFTTASEHLNVCARLEVNYIGSWKFPVPLSFLWRYEGEAKYPSETRMYSAGYITDSLELSPREHFQPGAYQVEIYNGRAMLASKELTVVSGR